MLSKRVRPARADLGVITSLEVNEDVYAILAFRYSGFVW